MVALVATAGYAHLLTPYMNSVPTVIAKASAIHNPIIYAITHPKYRIAIASYVPMLRLLLRVGDKDLLSSFSSNSGASLGSRRPTFTRHCSQVRERAWLSRACANEHWGKSRLSSASDTDSCWMENEADSSSVNSLPFDRRVSTEISTDTAIPNQQSAGVVAAQKVGVLSDSLRVSSISSTLMVFEGDVPDAGPSDVKDRLYSFCPTTRYTSSKYLLLRVN